MSWLSGPLFMMCKTTNFKLNHCFHYFIFESVQYLCVILKYLSQSYDDGPFNYMTIDPLSMLFRKADCHREIILEYVCYSCGYWVSISLFCCTYLWILQTQEK